MASALVMRADPVDLHACASGHLAASSTWRHWPGSAAAAAWPYRLLAFPAWTRLGWVSRTVSPGDRRGLPVPGRGCRVTSMSGRSRWRGCRSAGRPGASAVTCPARGSRRQLNHGPGAVEDDVVKLLLAADVA